MSSLVNYITVGYMSSLVNYITVGYMRSLVNYITVGYMSSLVNYITVKTIDLVVLPIFSNFLFLSSFKAHSHLCLIVISRNSFNRCFNVLRFCTSENKP